MTGIWVSFVFFYLTSNIVQYPEKYYRYSNSECRNGFMVSRNMYHLYYFDLILYFLPRKRWKVPDLYKTIFYIGNIRENWHFREQKSFVKIVFSVDIGALKLKLDLEYGNGQVEFDFRAKILTFDEMFFFMKGNNFFTRVTSYFCSL